MYKYEEHKSFVFSEAGQVSFLKVRDAARELLELSGAVKAGVLLGYAGSGDSWTNMALVDRLVELEELTEITGVCAWQDRIFVKGRKF